VACWSSLVTATNRRLQPREQHTPQRSMSTRSSTAGVAARPRAVRLDELPADVCAEALCWPPLRMEERRLQSMLQLWPARAGPAGVRGPSDQAGSPHARALEAGQYAADSLQARTPTGA